MSYIHVDGDILFVSHTSIACLEEELAYINKNNPDAIYEDHAKDLTKKLVAAKIYMHNCANINLLTTIIQKLDEQRNKIRREKQTILAMSINAINKNTMTLLCDARDEELLFAVGLLQSYTPKHKEE